MFVWRFCRGWRQFSSLFQFSWSRVLTRSVDFSAYLLKFFELFYDTSCCSFAKLHPSRIFRKIFLVCPVPEIFLCFAVPCAAFRFWIPRGVYGFYTVYMISILCPRYFLWFSEIPELCGDFPVFPPFIPLPRHVVVHCFFFILLRYSFLLFSMPRFIFLVYSAVKWLLPRKIFLLQGNLFDALVSRQRFDYFRTFVLPHRFYFCRVKFLLCVT